MPINTRDMRENLQDRGSNRAEIDIVRRSGTATFIERAVVIDVLHDPARIDQDFLSRIPNVANVAALTRAPRNSLIVRFIRDGAGKKGTAYVSYPLLSPHLALPVKPGEQVWIVRENSEAAESIPRWLSRVVESDAIDDINYTHADRRLINVRPKGTADRATGTPESDTPGFPNGNNTPDGATLFGDADAYDVLYANATATPSFVPEVVPRFTKRPGDTVLQGSNNTLIVLGQERGIPTTGAPTGQYSSATVPVGSAGSDPVVSSGAISIVAGRGAGDKTTPESIVNSRGFEEVQKRSPIESGLPDRGYNPSEGDLDFDTDLSYVNVSMRSSPDSDLGVTYPSFDLAPMQPVETAPHVTLRSTNARIVARDDGTVRIVKQSADGSTLGLVSLEADGTVVIEGQRIVLGSGRLNSNGQGDQVFIGNGAEEPLVLGNQLVTALDAFCAELELATGNLGALLTPVNVAATGLRGKLQSILSQNAKTR